VTNHQIYIAIANVEIVYLLRCAGIDMSSVWTHGWIENIPRIWWTNKCTSGIYGSMVCFRCNVSHICVTMHGHWQEFCWDAWM